MGRSDGGVEEMAYSLDSNRLPHGFSIEIETHSLIYSLTHFGSCRTTGFKGICSYIRVRHR